MVRAIEGVSHKSDTKIISLSFLSCLGIWIFLSLHWWVHVDGDNTLYPLTSIEVLRGQHFLMTPGQAHGGTILIYIRALLFKLFGISHFVGFFVNGLAVAMGAALWTRFTLRIAGSKAGLCMALLCTLVSERFVRAACTDYFAVTLVTSGLMLNLLEAWARKIRIGM